MKKPSNVRAGKSFKTLVAGISSPSDPSQGINSTVDRRAVTQQQISTGGGRHVNALITGSTSGATGTITVADNNFTTGLLGAAAASRSELHIGEHVLIADHHFTAHGEALADIADNIVAAINNLPGFSAASDGVDTVTVTGPSGPSRTVFDKVEKAEATNFTLSPTDGYLTLTGTTIGAPSHTMAG